jgi:hypothetical protein
MKDHERPPYGPNNPSHIVVNCGHAQTEHTYINAELFLYIALCIRKSPVAAIVLAIKAIPVVQTQIWQLYNNSVSTQHADRRVQRNGQLKHVSTFGAEEDKMKAAHRNGEWWVKTGNFW